jgi:hypothetical protein
VGIVSGTSIAWGPEVQFSNLPSNESVTAIDLDFDRVDPNICVIAYSDYRTSEKCFLVVGTLSGNSISFTSTTTVSSLGTSYNRIRFDKTRAGKFVVSYTMWSGPPYMYYVREGTLSGTSVTLGSEIALTELTGAQPHTAFSYHAANSATMLLVNGITGASLVGLTSPVTSTTTTYLTDTNFIGISSASYTDSDTATITLPGGIASNLSGLTPGQTYYVQPSDGSLGTTEGNPSVLVGRALSSTVMLLKG